MGKLAQDYIQLHNEGKFPGTTLLVYKSHIANIIKYHNIKTALDVGCGKAAPYHMNKIDEEWGVDVTLYDPYFPPHSTKPAAGETFDLVIACDVVEHVPEDEIQELLQELFTRANKAVVITFCNRPAKKTLPITGGNVHITQRERQWWEQQLYEAQEKTNKKTPFYLFENNT